MIIVRKQYKQKYLNKYGEHFNEKLSNYAISLMCHSSKTILNKLQVEQLLKTNNINVSNFYDALYVTNMAYMDYYGSSIADETHLALFIKDFIQDEDGYESKPFQHWVIDMKNKNINIDWNDMI